MATASIKNLKSPIAMVSWISTITLLVIVIIKTPVFAAANLANGNDTAKGLIKNEIEVRQSLISVTLIGATEYEITELFYKILEKTPGVVEVKRYLFILDPSRPRVCRVDWQVRVDKMTPFQLESAVYRTVRDVADGDNKQHPSFYVTPEQQKLMANIRPLHATSREIRFHFLHLESNHANDATVERFHGKHWPDTGFE